MDVDSREHVLDTRGLLCPEPVMMLHTRITEIPLGEVLLVLATDPSNPEGYSPVLRFSRP